MKKTKRTWKRERIKFIQRREKNLPGGLSPENVKKTKTKQKKAFHVIFLSSTFTLSFCRCVCDSSANQRKKMSHPNGSDFSVFILFHRKMMSPTTRSRSTRNH